MTSFPVLMFFLVAGVWQCNGVSLMRVKEVDVRILENEDFHLGWEKYFDCMKNDIKDSCKIEMFETINKKVKGYLNIKFKKDIKKMEIKFKLNNKDIYDNEIDLIDKKTNEIKKSFEISAFKKKFTIKDLKEEIAISDLHIKINKINIEEKKFCYSYKIKVEEIKSKFAVVYKMDDGIYKCFLA